MSEHYRLLNVGEACEATDEYWSPSQRVWVNLGGKGRTASILEPPIRRLVKSGWRLIAEEKPVMPCVATDGINLGACLAPWPPGAPYTHWKPVGPLPEPPLPDAEKAWLEHCSTRVVNNPKDTYNKALFLAGWEARGKE